jgi:hypothetical protein
MAAMSRRMSCSLTVEAVRNRTKTVTRRETDTWRTLKPGDRLVLVEKAMGLRKGERQVVLAEVEIVDVRVEPLSNVTLDEVRREGSPEPFWTPDGWCEWWLLSHGYTPGTDAENVNVRRIEWRYLDDLDDIPDDELPGMWERADFTGGRDYEVRP